MIPGCGILIMEAAGDSILPLDSVPVGAGVLPLDGAPDSAGEIPGDGDMTLSSVLHGM